MSLFFELLQIALGTREKLSRVPNAREWEAMYDEAERQAVVGVLLDGLERLPDEQLPPLEVKLQWIGEVQMMEAEYRQHLEKAVELTSRFRAVGFKSCVLKGVGTAQLYPHPERRQCGDIDLWVSGRRKDVMRYMRSEYAVGSVKWHHVDVEIYDDVPTEIHFHPIWLYNPFRNRRLQRYFNEQKAAQMVERDGGFGYPSVEFNAIYSLVHTFHHLMDEGVGLRHIVDYFYVLGKCHTDNTDITDILRVLKSIGLGKFAGAMMYVLKEACGMASEELLCEPDEEAGKFLLGEIMLAGNFGHFDSRTIRPENETFWQRNARKFRRQLRFVEYYHGEVFGAPVWKTWHKGWRMVNQR